MVNIHDIYDNNVYYLYNNICLMRCENLDILFKSIECTKLSSRNIIYIMSNIYIPYIKDTYGFITDNNKILYVPLKYENNKYFYLDQLIPDIKNIYLIKYDASNNNKPNTRTKSNIKYITENNISISHTDNKHILVKCKNIHLNNELTQHMFNILYPSIIMYINNNMYFETENNEIICIHNTDDIIKTDIIKYNLNEFDDEYCIQKYQEIQQKKKFKTEDNLIQYINFE